ncbi:MAG TPA: CGGC domain-containing protein [Bacteroidales bacterium]|nr:CGGC domain-containing protein [Bacteroidales bacterium]HSA43011.1 CGGC domain-containing protein [Bacteroidales bacterium]
MIDKIKIGIVICDRYSSCAGGKCFRSFMNREGAFSHYQGKEAEIAGYTSCGGCPGGNIEYAPEEMKKNGITHIHFATGLLVGYPPCPYMEHFESFIREKYGLKVVFGTHPIPEKYYLTHMAMQTWNTPFLQRAIRDTLCDSMCRLRYD